MRDTSFNLRAIGNVLLGNPGAAVPLDNGANEYRRVLLRTNAAGPVFISNSSQELETPGAVRPGAAFQLPASTSIVLSIDPRERLYAASAVAGRQLSISISTPITRTDHSPGTGNMQLYPLPPTGSRA